MRPVVGQNGFAGSEPVVSQDDVQGKAVGNQKKRGRSRSHHHQCGCVGRWWRVGHRISQTNMRSQVLEREQDPRIDARGRFGRQRSDLPEKVWTQSEFGWETTQNLGESIRTPNRPLASVFGGPTRTRGDARATRRRVEEDRHRRPSN